MIASISYAYPDPEFWQNIRTWENSLNNPVFKSPHYIKYLANRFKKELAIYKFVEGGELKGVVFFRKFGNEYRLLTDVKADHNFFVIRKRLYSGTTEQFFQVLFAAIRKENWALVLRVQPILGFLHAGLYQSRANRACSGMWPNVRFVRCWKKKRPKELFDKLNSSRELRYQVDRIKSQLNGEYEILTGDEDLKEWVKKFCELHRQRWTGTGSPSRYEDSEEEKFLENCLKSWIDDEALVRFAVKVGETCCIRHLPDTAEFIDPPFDGL